MNVSIIFNARDLVEFEAAIAIAKANGIETEKPKREIVRRTKEEIKAGIPLAQVKAIVTSEDKPEEPEFENAFD